MHGTIHMYTSYKWCAYKRYHRPKLLATLQHRMKPVPADMKKLGNRIKQLRISKGYSNYEAFAYEHDIPRSQYGRYERGHDLRFSSLLKIIKALDISIEEFFSEGFG